MTTMLGPPHPVAMPTVTKTDKLRLAAAKGELEVVRDLLDSGTPLQPDKVGLLTPPQLPYSPLTESFSEDLITISQISKG